MNSVHHWPSFEIQVTCPQHSSSNTNLTGPLFHCLHIRHCVGALITLSWLTVTNLSSLKSLDQSSQLQSTSYENDQLLRSMRCRRTISSRWISQMSIFLKINIHCLDQGHQYLTISSFYIDSYGARYFLFFYLDLYCLIFEIYSIDWAPFLMDAIKIDQFRCLCIITSSPLMEILFWNFFFFFLGHLWSYSNKDLNKKSTTSFIRSFTRQWPPESSWISTLLHRNSTTDSVSFSLLSAISSPFE